MHLYRISANARYIYILFDVRADRLVNSPFYWYFFAYLDPKLMGLADPTFLIPSTDFHELAAPRLRNGVWIFTLAAAWSRTAGTAGTATASERPTWERVSWRFWSIYPNRAARPSRRLTS